MEEQIIAALKGTLQPDGAVVQAAEQHLINDLHPRPEAGLALVRIVYADSNASSIPLAIRQAAAVNLGKWITERWSAFFEGFLGFPVAAGQGSSSSVGPAAPADTHVALPQEYKVPIREALLGAMVLPESKLRGPMIKALINVATCDWPDEFPDLLPRTSALLQASSSASSAVQLLGAEGALAFLDEWSYSTMDESSLLSVTRDLFPELERLVSDSALSPQIRCHCIRILDQTLETLHLVKSQYPDAAKRVTKELLPRWLAILASIVGTDPTAFFGSQGFSKSTGEHLALQEQTWTTLMTITAYSAQLQPHLHDLLRWTLAALTSLEAPFEAHHLRGDGEIEVPDEVRFFATPMNVAGSIIDFVVKINQKASLRSAVSGDYLAAFVPFLVSFSRITAADEEEWLADASQFVAAGDDDEVGALGSSLRSRCIDALTELSTSKADDVLLSLQTATKSSNASGQRRRASRDSGWWREEESSLHLVGAQASNITDRIEEAQEQQQKVPFSVDEIFSTSVMPYMDEDTPPFLHGRCFVFASQYAGLIPVDFAEKFLEAAVQALEDNRRVNEEGNDIVKLSAVRCVKNFHHHLSDKVTGKYAERILSQIAPLLQQDNEDLLILVIETLLSVSGQSDDSTTSIPVQVYGEIAAACIQAWSRQPNFYIVQSTVDDMLDSFASQRDLAKAESTLYRSIPILAELLDRFANDLDNDAAPTTIGGALHFASALARGADASLLERCEMIKALFVPLFEIAGKTDDRAIHQSAAQLLTTLFNKLSSTYTSWSDAKGMSAVQHTLLLISKMVAPDDVAESGGLAPGQLLTTMLRKQPQCLQDHLEGIAHAFVSRLAMVQMPLLAQSLIIPLAYLIKDHVDVVVALLLRCPIGMSDGTTQSGLVVLLRKWLEFASSIQGFWQERISALGLCAIFQARNRIALVSRELDTVYVDGDLIPDDVNIIKTRSRSRNMPDRFTQVSIPAKIIKVLAAEYKEAIDGPPQKPDGSNGANENGAAFSVPGGGGDDDDEWDDDGDDEEDADNLFSNPVLTDFADIREMERKEQEESFGDDPIWNMPYRTFLKSFFQDAVRDPSSATLIEPHLNEKERTLIQNALA